MKIDTNRFWNDIDVIFTEKELEKSPTKLPLNFTVNKLIMPESKMSVQ